MPVARSHRQPQDLPRVHGGHTQAYASWARDTNETRTAPPERAEQLWRGQARTSTCHVGQPTCGMQDAPSSNSPAGREANTNQLAPCSVRGGALLSCVTRDDRGKGHRTRRQKARTQAALGAEGGGRGGRALSVPDAKLNRRLANPDPPKLCGAFRNIANSDGVESKGWATCTR